MRLRGRTAPVQDGEHTNMDKEVHKLCRRTLSLTVAARDVNEVDFVTTRENAMLALAWCGDEGRSFSLCLQLAFCGRLLERSGPAVMTYESCWLAKDAATSFLIFSPKPLCR